MYRSCVVCQEFNQWLFCKEATCMACALSRGEGSPDFPPDFVDLLHTVLTHELVHNWCGMNESKVDPDALARHIEGYFAKLAESAKSSPKSRSASYTSTLHSETHTLQGKTQLHRNALAHACTSVTNTFNMMLHRTHLACHSCSTHTHHSYLCNKTQQRVRHGV